MFFFFSFFNSSPGLCGGAHARDCRADSRCDTCAGIFLLRSGCHRLHRRLTSGNTRHTTHDTQPTTHKTQNTKNKHKTRTTSSLGADDLKCISSFLSRSFAFTHFALDFSFRSHCSPSTSHFSLFISHFSLRISDRVSHFFHLPPLRPTIVPPCANTAT